MIKSLSHLFLCGLLLPSLLTNIFVIICILYIVCFEQIALHIRNISSWNVFPFIQDFPVFLLSHLVTFYRSLLHSLEGIGAFSSISEGTTAGPVWTQGEKTTTPSRVHGGTHPYIIIKTFEDVIYYAFST